MRVYYGIMMQHFSVDDSFLGDKSNKVPKMSVRDVDHGSYRKHYLLVSRLGWVVFLFLLHFSFIIGISPIFQQLVAKLLDFSEKN